tara:strand:+ start:318 stop:590 length:273 start_codon:yes stop_codon:yes gene_type:complete
MPQSTDSNYDALVEQYAEIVTDRLAEDPKALYEFTRETLVDYYENMTEKDLIGHVAEMGDEELIEEIYGNYPPQDIEGQYSLKKGESIVV